VGRGTSNSADAGVRRAQSEAIEFQRPTGTHLLVLPTPRTIPYNTVTNCNSKNADKLVPDIDWQSRTIRSELKKAFNSRKTHTSLDQNFRKGGAPEFNHDGDDIAVWEPSEELGSGSLTMNQPGTENVIETVRYATLPDGTRVPHSYFERETTVHHSPEELDWSLPENYKNTALGIRSRLDAQFIYAVWGMVMRFNDVSDHDTNGTRDSTIAEFIRRSAATYKPSSTGFAGVLDTKALRLRLRKVTEHEVRDIREKLQAVGVMSA